MIGASCTPHTSSYLKIAALGSNHRNVGAGGGNLVRTSRNVRTIAGRGDVVVRVASSSDHLQTVISDPINAAADMVVPSELACMLSVIRGFFARAMSAAATLRWQRFA
jgi:hypothetical protein